MKHAGPFHHQSVLSDRGQGASLNLQMIALLFPNSLTLLIDLSFLQGYVLSYCDHDIPCKHDISERKEENDLTKNL